MRLAAAGRRGAADGLVGSGRRVVPAGQPGDCSDDGRGRTAVRITVWVVLALVVLSALIVLGKGRPPTEPFWRRTVGQQLTLVTSLPPAR